MQTYHRNWEKGELFNLSREQVECWGGWSWSLNQVQGREAPQVCGGGLPAASLVVWRLPLNLLNPIYTFFGLH
jgi:hypothetical protein